MREINLLRSYDHPGIIRVMEEGVYQDHYPFVVLEYMHQSLHGLYKSRRQITERNKIGLVVQLLSALDYLSRQDPPGVHRDIKPQNILFKATSCVLGDFGLLFLNHLRESRARPDDWTAPKVPPMAQNYRTPELVRHFTTGIAPPPASDVFQLGLVGAELFTGMNPYRPSPPNQPVVLSELGSIQSPLGEPITAALRDMLEMDFENDLLPKYWSSGNDSWRLGSRLPKEGKLWPSNGRRRKFKR